MPKRHIVELNDEQRERLNKLVNSTKTSIRERKHARILLLSDEHRQGGRCRVEEICQQVRTSPATVARVRANFVQEGLERALYHKPQQKRAEPVLDGRAEAFLVALVCAAPPEEHKRWTLHLLKDRLIEHGYVDSVSHETIRQRLKKTNLSLG